MESFNLLFEHPIKPVDLPGKYRRGKRPPISSSAASPQNVNITASGSSLRLAFREEPHPFPDAPFRSCRKGGAAAYLPRTTIPPPRWAQSVPVRCTSPH